MSESQSEKNDEVAGQQNEENVTEQSEENVTEQNEENEPELSEEDDSELSEEDDFSPGEDDDPEPSEEGDSEPSGEDDSEPSEEKEPLSVAEIAANVEAILFSTDTPITPAKILQVAELSCKRDVTDAIDILNDRYEESGSAFRIEIIAGGYRLQTLEAYHQVLSRLFKVKSESKLSQPAMETLSIVAYRQPVLRADIEAIRGVACGEVLRGLMEKMLIKIVGRAEVIGRPMLYGTTRRFLEVFGLASLSDLPRADELRQAPQTKAPEPPAAEESDDQAQDAPAQDESTPQDQPEQPETPAEPQAEAVVEAEVDADAVTEDDK
jgi:segregation and condensation protein B